jgi:hypothetical protein
MSEKNVIDAADGPNQGLPEKVTLPWLAQHVPVSLWLAFVGILISAALLGVTLGQTTFIREMTGKDSPATAPPISSQELKERVDRLIEGHNNSTEILNKAIAEEERAAATSIYGLEQLPHIEAAERLRNTLLKENEVLKEDLIALKALERKR